MNKPEFLTKHCTTARDGRVALSNTLVETAVKRYNCPIIVTCNAYPNEECILTVSDLTASVPKTMRHPDQFNPGNTYDLYYYLWKGTPKVNRDKEGSKAEEVVSNNTKDRTYMINTMKMVPTVVETPTTFWGYIGHVVKTRREELNLTDREVVKKITEQQGGEEKSFAINTYRSIERGEETNSKINTYIYIAEALNLHISELIPPKN
jgi:hypothetical protein